MNLKQVGMAVMLGGTALVGCVSPIHSQDPATRKEAMEKVTDQQELFFIAMNVGVGIKGKWPEMYQETHLRSGEYADDVRVMAVNKLTDTDYLLRCAAWKDNDLYEDKAAEDGRFLYKGETHYLNGNYKANMMEKVAPGDVVRDAAKKRLKLSAVGKSLAGDIRTRLFPSSSHWTGSGYRNSGETTFVDTYGQIKNNNPFDIVMCDLVDAENSSSEIVTFLKLASSGGPVLTPNAYGKALRKLNGIDSETAKKLFRKLFIGSEDSDSNEKIEIRQRRSASVAKASTVENPSKDWPWLVYQHIDDPEVEIIKTALALSDNTAREKILRHGKLDSELLKSIALDVMHKHTLDSWNNGRNDELETAVLIAKNVSDKKIGGRIAVALICKLNAYRSRCQSGWGLSWSNKDKSTADKFTKSVEDLLTDDLLEEIVNDDDSKLVSLAHLFKDKKRSSKLGFTRIQNAVKEGKENVITKAWKDYGGAVTDDEMLKTLSVSSIYLRRPAFDQIKDDKVKADTLAAIKESLAAELKACAAKQGELANFIGEIGNGDDLIAWLKGKSGQTNLQNKETFAKQKGRIVVLRGEVKNIGQTMFSSKTYVSLRVAKVGMFDYIDVQFNVPDSLKPTVTAWMKGESHIMRGKLTSQGDLEDDAKCDDGEIVSEEKFNEAVNLKEAMEDIKWQLKEIDEKKVPPVRMRTSRFGNAVKSAAGWIKDGVDDIKSSGDDLKQAAEMLNGLFN